MRIERTFRAAIRQTRTRVATLFVAIALATLSVSALAHTLTHELDAPDASCAICLTAHHLGKTLAAATLAALPTPGAVTPVLPPDTDIPAIATSGYRSRAPPVSHAA